MQRGHSHFVYRRDLKLHTLRLGVEDIQVWKPRGWKEINVNGRGGRWCKTEKHEDKIHLWAFG